MSHRAMSHRPRAASLPVDPTRARRARRTRRTRNASATARRRASRKRRSAHPREQIRRPAPRPSTRAAAEGGGGVARRPGVVRFDQDDARDRRAEGNVRCVTERCDAAGGPHRRRAPSPAGPARASTAFDASLGTHDARRARARPSPRFVAAESLAAEADVDLDPGREGRRDRGAVVAGIVACGQEREEGRERGDEALAIVARGRPPVLPRRRARRDPQRGGGYRHDGRAVRAPGRESSSGR